MSLKTAPDPRIPIAMHMGWQRSTVGETTWQFPEPDNYNRAILSTQAKENKKVKYSAFYRDAITGFWWSVYYVSPDQQADFDAWALEQDYKLIWQHDRAGRAKPARKMLYATAAAEITDNERLFAMGYYAKFASKYFSDNDAMLLERLGPIRDCVLRDLQEEDLKDGFD